MLIYKGKIKVDNLLKVRLSVTELEVAAREHGIQDIREVDLAVLEIDDNISMLTHNFQRQHKTNQNKLLNQIKDFADTER